MRIVHPKNRIRELRRAADMPSHELAQRLGVDRTTLYRWETGTVGVPDTRKVEIAAIFKVSVGWLMGWTEPGNGNGGNGDPVCKICGDRKSA